LSPFSQSLLCGVYPRFVGSLLRYFSLLSRLSVLLFLLLLARDAKDQNYASFNTPPQSCFSLRFWPATLMLPPNFAPLLFSFFAFIQFHDVFVYTQMFLVLRGLGFPAVGRTCPLFCTLNPTPPTRLIFRFTRGRFTLVFRRPFTYFLLSAGDEPPVDQHYWRLFFPILIDPFVFPLLLHFFLPPPSLRRKILVVAL